MTVLLWCCLRKDEVWIMSGRAVASALTSPRARTVSTWASVGLVELFAQFGDVKVRLGRGRRDMCVCVCGYGR